MTTIETVKLLKGCAYQLWNASLRGGGDHSLFDELKNPAPGNLVMELTTHRMPGRNPAEGIGRLISIAQEPTSTREQWKEAGGGDDDPIPTHTVYTIELVFDNSRMIDWSNASFIKVKTE